MKVIKIKTILKKAIWLLALILVLNGLILFPTNKEISQKVALISAGFIMPEGIANYISSSITDSYSSKQNKATESVTDINNVIDKTETNVNEAVIATTKQTQEPLTPPEGTKRGGSVKETQYTTTSETTSYKNIVFLNRTDTHKVDLAKQLEQKLDLKTIKKGEPSVLIFHSHTTEAYQPYDMDWYVENFKERSLNSEENMIRVGEEIVKQLESAGIMAIHDKKVYDNPDYTGSYERSAKTIDEYLEKYPSIQVILDVHRDCIEYDDGTKVKPTVTINNKKAAQIMIIAGCEEGKITDFKDWEYNLRFALNLHNSIESDYPGLMRPLFFAPRKYNMDKSHFSLLIEMGSDVNTLNEAVYSGEMLGKSLAKFLGNYTQ